MLGCGRGEHGVMLGEKLRYGITHDKSEIEISNFTDVVYPNCTQSLLLVQANARDYYDFY